MSLPQQALGRRFKGTDAEAARGVLPRDRCTAAHSRTVPSLAPDSTSAPVL